MDPLVSKYVISLSLLKEMNLKKNHNELADKELLIQVKAGDQEAYRALFDRYYNVLCKQATFCLKGDVSTAEDVVQQVFIDFWFKKKYEVVDTSVAAYLGKMVQFKAIDFIRKSVVRRGHEMNQSIDIFEQWEDSNTTRIQELEKALRKEITELPKQCRSIFTAVYLEGKKYKEVADNHGISINTVKEQVRRAMVKLRRKMNDIVNVIIWLSFFCHPYLII